MRRHCLGAARVDGLEMSALSLVSKLFSPEVEAAAGRVCQIPLRAAADLEYALFTIWEKTFPEGNRYAEAFVDML